MNGLAESKGSDKGLPIQVRNLHKGSYRCPATISHVGDAWAPWGAMTRLS